MQILSAFLGLAVTGGLLAYALYAFSSRWRQLTRAYEAPWPMRPVAQKRLESVILRGGGSLWMNHMVSIRVTEEGVAMRLVPFGFFNPAAVFPFAELKAEPANWYLNRDSWALTAARAQDYKIIIPGDLLDWIRAHALVWQPKP